MILGIITAAVFVLVSAIFFTQKLKDDSRIKKLFTVIHKPLGYLLVVLAVVHLAITLSLIWQRPFIIYLLGIGMITCSIAAIIVRRQMEDKRKAFAWHKLCALAIALFLIVHVVCCVTSFNEYKQDVAAISFSDPDTYSIADGEYTGECDVGYIFAKVNVTVSDGVVTNIDLLEHRNERGKAGEGVIDEMLSEQRTDVDAVSGATNSSKVIKKAVENALEKGINR
jgi:uncharacterized protein with FMN-binding domain